MEDKQDMNDELLNQILQSLDAKAKETKLALCAMVREKTKADIIRIITGSGLDIETKANLVCRILGMDREKND